ncbi:hypothetical protein A2U01_0092275, partial [Trifolium medium]|nr:hypothetical protein [Trifolium medium]
MVVRIVCFIAAVRLVLYVKNIVSLKTVDLTWAL